MRRRLPVHQAGAIIARRRPASRMRPISSMASRGRQGQVGDAVQAAGPLRHARRRSTGCAHAGSRSAPARRPPSISSQSSPKFGNSAVSSMPNSSSAAMRAAALQYESGIARRSGARPAGPLEPCPRVADRLRLARRLQFGEVQPLAAPRQPRVAELVVARSTARRRGTPGRCDRAHRPRLEEVLVAVDDGRLDPRLRGHGSTTTFASRPSMKSTAASGSASSGTRASTCSRTVARPSRMNTMARSHSSGR